MTAAAAVCAQFFASAAGQVRAMRVRVRSIWSPSERYILIECHATGTSVGDAVELQSMSEVFRGLRDVPIGSLKSNLGHLITVSGAAGIIKVLEAFRHDRRPATLHASPATKALDGTPFRVLSDEEPWVRGRSTPHAQRSAVLDSAVTTPICCLRNTNPVPVILSAPLRIDAGRPLWQ